MSKNVGKPRLDQYRIGSVLYFKSEDENNKGFYQILRIDKLKTQVNLYAVHLWKIGTEEPKDIYKTPWNSAQGINEMLDNGTMQVASY